MILNDHAEDSKKAKAIELLKRLLITIVVLFFCYVLFAMVVLRASSDENLKSKDFFYDRHPDLLVVYTGAKGRIPETIELAKKYNLPHIFISGVYSKNTVNSLIKPILKDESFDTSQLEIDYLAKNTFENVILTRRYLRSNTFNKILVISHDYHIKRIKLIFESLKVKQDKFEVYYTGIESDYGKLSNILILYKEVYKYFQTYFFLLFWDEVI